MKETRPWMFDRYVSSYLEYGKGNGEPLQMALGGEKPATPFDPPSELFAQCLLDRRGLIKKWGLHYRRIPAFPGVIVSPSSHWLDLLSTVETNADAYARRLGLVYGYPLPDINNYLRTDGSAYTPLKYVAQGVFPADEVAFVSFTFYRPEESESGYERAISIGKRHYNRIHELSHEWGLPVLATMADELYRSSIESYSPEEYSSDALKEMIGFC